MAQDKKDLAMAEDKEDVAVPPGYVAIRITKKGAGMVHTGGAPGETFEANERTIAEAAIATELEDRGFVEIL